MKVTETKPFNEATHGVGTLRQVIFTDNAGYRSSFHFHRYPTNNCQLGSIAAAANFLEKVDSDKDIEELFTSLKNNIQPGVYPPQFIIDVKQKYAQLVRDYFTCVVDAPYTSTNGSNMVLFIVKSPI
jgi:hypothetical protein